MSRSYEVQPNMPKIFPFNVVQDICIALRSGGYASLTKEQWVEAVKAVSYAMGCVAVFAGKHFPDGRPTQSLQELFPEELESEEGFEQALLEYFQVTMETKGEQVARNGPQALTEGEWFSLFMVLHFAMQQLCEYDLEQEEQDDELEQDDKSEEEEQDDESEEEEQDDESEEEEQDDESEE